MLKILKLTFSLYPKMLISTYNTSSLIIPLLGLDFLLLIRSSLYTDSLRLGRSLAFLIARRLIKFDVAPILIITSRLTPLIFTVTTVCFLYRVLVSDYRALAL